MRAIWHGQTIAHSDDTVEVEGSHYFPKASVRDDVLIESPTAIAPGEGQAAYYTLIVDGDQNDDAAWYYPEPASDVPQLHDRIAFGKDVKVVD